MATKKRTKGETRLIKAMAHPLRHRILEELNAKQASPSVLAEELGEPIGNVSYHVQVLLECDAIELVSTRPVRGAVEHIYRATIRPFWDDKQWARLPISVRNQLQEATIHKAWEHLVEAANTGGLDHPETHVSWTALDLDQQGYDEVVELLGQTLERVLEIHSEAAGRLVEVPDDERQEERTELAIFHYHRPRAGSAPPAGRSRQRNKVTR
jgi:DNA-binding transcriptional ArsR family regulator